jgi:hypothetical protein
VLSRVILDAIAALTLDHGMIVECGQPFHCA